MPFDPDAYLKSKQDFDPDAYLSAAGAKPPAPKPAPAAVNTSPFARANRDFLSAASQIVSPFVDPIVNMGGQISGGAAGLLQALRAHSLTAPSVQNAVQAATPPTLHPDTMIGRGLEGVQNAIGSGMAYLPQKIANPVAKAGYPGLATAIDLGGQAAEGAMLGRVAPVAGEKIGAAMDRATALPASVPIDRMRSVLELENRGVPVSARQVLRGQKSAPAWGGTRTAQTADVHNQYRAAIGEPPGETFGPEQLRSARQRLNSDYETIPKGKKFVLPSQFFEGMNDSLAEMKRLQDAAGRSAAPSKAIERLSNMAKKYNMAKASGMKNPQTSMRGEDYQEIRSLLGKDIRSARDPELKNTLRKVQDELDNHAEHGMPEIAPDLRRMRTQWRNLSVLEDAAEGQERGLIPPQRVHHFLEQRYGTRMAEPGTALANDPLVRIANASKSLNIGHPGVTTSPPIPGLGVHKLLEMGTLPFDAARAKLLKYGQRRAAAPSITPQAADPALSSEAADLLRLR
jgi:hypothetical protein